MHPDALNLAKGGGGRRGRGCGRLQGGGRGEGCKKVVKAVAVAGSGSVIL